jgi:hypothetical protein
MWPVQESNAALTWVVRPGERLEADREMDWMQAQMDEALRLKSADLNASV